MIRGDGKGRRTFNVVCCSYRRKSGVTVVLKKKIKKKSSSQGTFFKSPHIANSWAHSAIANPQILTFTSPQIANPPIFMIDPQISTKHCKTLSQNRSKSRLFKMIFSFCSLYSKSVRRRSMYLRICVSFKSANHKKIGANPQSVTLAEGPQI